MKALQYYLNGVSELSDLLQEWELFSKNVNGLIGMGNADVLKINDFICIKHTSN